MKGKAVRIPSGSMPLFQLRVSPSSNFEDGERTQEAPGIRTAYSIPDKEGFIEYWGIAASGI
jgi:hypothetical protein